MRTLAPSSATARRERGLSKTKVMTDPVIVVAISDPPRAHMTPCVPCVRSQGRVATPLNVKTSTPPTQESIARRTRFEAALARFQHSDRVIKSISGSGGDGSLEQPETRTGAAQAEGDRFAEVPNLEPEVREVVEELVELVAEEERQASVASASPPVVQAPKCFLGAQWILMESCLLEMQEIKKQFVAEKARAHALQQDLAVQKDKVASLEQEREEEAQAARREAQTVQRDLSVRTTELNTLREKLAEAEQVASSQRLRDQQEINAIREQLRAREEITPVTERTSPERSKQPNQHVRHVSYAVVWIGKRQWQSARRATLCANRASRAMLIRKCQMVSSGFVAPSGLHILPVVLGAFQNRTLRKSYPQTFMKDTCGVCASRYVLRNTKNRIRSCSGLPLLWKPCLCLCLCLCHCL